MKDDYIITRITPQSWDVFNEPKSLLYRVDKVDQGWKCNCPHWYHRLRHTGGNCKHILMVIEAEERSEKLANQIKEEVTE